MHTKQQTLYIEIKRVANLLGVESLTIKEFLENSMMTRGDIYRHGGGWTKSVQAAGLKPTDVGLITSKKNKASRTHLLAALIRLESRGIKITQQSISEHTEFSSKPYLNAFVTLSEANLEAKAAYARGELDILLSKEPNLPVRSPGNIIELNEVMGFIKAASPRVTKKAILGERIDFRGMRYGPVNELGVVYLFGMVGAELGFITEVIQSPYPDCVAKFKTMERGLERWRELAIEFEYVSSNFEKHGHNPNECDMIICWKHDWKNVPASINILELRTSIKYLNASGRC